MMMFFKAAPPAPPPTPETLLFRSSGAFSPACFFPMHAAVLLLTARAFPAKRITYPLLTLLHTALYAAEHFAAELPTLAEAGPLLGPVFFLSLALFFCFSFKATTSKKAWAGGLAAFLVALPAFAANDLGIPKDVVSEQKAANFDAHYTKWHMALHAALVVSLSLATAGVRWTTDAASATMLAPRSPHHTTHTQLSPGRARSNECTSPKRFAANWPKPPKVE